jgi:hypothetical protein
MMREMSAKNCDERRAGAYTFKTLPAGCSYTIKPLRNGFKFAPAARSITNLSAGITAGASTNFNGTGR